MHGAALEWNVALWETIWCLTGITNTLKRSAKSLVILKTESLFHWFSYVGAWLRSLILKVLSLSLVFFYHKLTNCNFVIVCHLGQVSLEKEMSSLRRLSCLNKGVRNVFGSILAICRNVVRRSKLFWKTYLFLVWWTLKRSRCCPLMRNVMAALRRNYGWVFLKPNRLHACSVFNTVVKRITGSRRVSAPV